MTRLLSRLAAAAFLLLAAGAAWGLVAHWGEPGLRSVARGVFALALLDLARMAWRWPQRQPERFRERATRLLSVLATPALHEDYAETSPQVSLPVAILDDWDVLARQRRSLEPGALSASQGQALDDLARVVDHLRPAVLALGMTPTPELPQHEAWRLLVAAAERARTAWLADPSA